MTADRSGADAKGLEVDRSHYKRLLVSLKTHNHILFRADPDLFTTVARATFLMDTQTKLRYCGVCTAVGHSQGWAIARAI